MMMNRLAGGMGALVVSVAVLPAISVSAAAAPIAAPATSVAGQDVLRDGGVWYFKAKHSGKCLTVHGGSTAKGAAVDQYTCLNRSNQRWRLLYTSQWGVAYVIAEHSGKCLDALGGGKANGTKIVQWDCNSRSNQSFHVRNLSGYVALKPLHAAHKCLDVPGASQRNNTQLVLWSCKSVSNQQFKMVRA
ncbi:RICIN domain-containing protein [Streptomyces sp. NPDC028722]|uniref:RICIN domain-containing protein n=1 Tax=Streptomyces sp. NPDC028722 TaxID=3155016 RepID=UPI0033ED7C5A